MEPALVRRILNKRSNPDLKLTLVVFVDIKASKSEFTFELEGSNFCLPYATVKSALNAWDEVVAQHVKPEE